MPRQLLLPTLDADLENFPLDYGYYVMAMPNAQKENDQMDIEKLFVASYFDTLLNLLNILNELFNCGDQIIGLEVESTNNTVHVFPDSKDKATWVNKTLRFQNYIHISWMSFDFFPVQQIQDERAL